MTQTSASVQSSAVDYARHGWALVPFEVGLKGPDSQPQYVGWNTREKCISDPAAARQITGNLGLAHAYSGTCAIDFDDLERAAAWLAERGIDAKALLSAADAVRISSGRPNRAKLLYRLTKPLPSKAIKTAERKTILEFRCASRDLKSVQDVLPPSIHPETQMPYTWEYGDDLIGDWRNAPEIPAALLNLWQAQVAENKTPESESSPFANSERATPEHLRELLKAWSPDIGYDDWLRVGMACHYESRGNRWGLDIWDTWSKAGKTYKGRADLVSHYRSFVSSGDRLVTAGSLRVSEPATADDFRDLSLEAQAEFDTPTVGAIPEAQHLCTDQANAQRIAKVFGNKLLACAGRFYHWTGTRWSPDEGEAQRCASNLSKIVGKEARRARERADKAFAALNPEILKAAAEHPKKNSIGKTESGADAMGLMARADALETWSTRCEFKAVQDAAIGLLRKLLTVSPDVMDRDPWALNCLNGTIDLRTGALRLHNPSDYITRLAPVEYRAEAPAAKFEGFVEAIMNADAPRVRFLKRWFGYCATGDVREQKLVCHIGAGANGKGTLLNAIQDVLGDYVGTAAPGLLTSSGGNERHPTEIADLFGKRLVTAHETDDSAVLREGFVKQATGGDKLKARFMRADFFEFAPTHKLQLLTNHRPAIRGQDYGIWRRILLVPYATRFGSTADIESGRADALRDDGLGEALRAEREGIFRWIVEGAVAWYEGGLQPPDSVIGASQDYQREQDRTSQFLDECCELGVDKWAPFSGAFGLYPRYQAWCKESGYFAIGKGRFVADLERVIPFFRKEKRNEGRGSTRRNVHGAFGVTLINQGLEDLL